jgi:hypothetical protein
MLFGPCSTYGCVKIVGGVGYSEFGGKGGWVMGNMFRRGESSWLRMKFEFAFFADHGFLIRVLRPFFLALTVNELCLLFWPNPYATSCFVLHIFRMGVFMLFLGRCAIYL